MTLVFSVCLAVGAVTMLYSLLAGGDSHADAHADAGGAGDASASAEAGEVHGAADFWLLFGSTRFWAFFLTFFGLTGLLLKLAGAGSLLATLIAAPTGAGMGLGAAWVFKRLREETVTSEVAPDQLVGMEAKVLLPVSNQVAGKVRLQLPDRVLDRIALLEGKDELAPGERALVISVRGDKLVVARAPTLPATDTENKEGRSAS